MKKQIILASASPRRRELLSRLGLAFDVMVSNEEERYTASDPEEIVQQLALQKAENVCRELLSSGKSYCKTEKDGLARETIIIGADTVVVLNGKILGKPKDEEDAYRMISELQGISHQVYTGTAILTDKAIITHAEKTTVYVHSMSDTEIRRYIATGEPMDKAGAYGIQGAFGAFIDRIEGDYYNVVGLPVAYLYQELKALDAFSHINI